jgi:lysophospholipase L1-like esterase
VHSIQNDYSEVKSAVELKLGKVDNWCLDGGDKNCARCDDPTKAVHRMDNRMWGHALAANTKDAQALVDQRADVDVVFLGDQNVEARAGRWYGGNGNFKKDSQSKKSGRFWDNTDIPELLRKSNKKFNKYFDKPSTAGAKYKGVAMGISGDTSPNLLWRIQNSEVLTLQPKVWWLNVGINDLMATSCSEEITLLGILRVVEELMMKKDGSTIVINSILPISTRSDMKLEGENTSNKFWTAAKVINERLKRFAKKNPGVKFFDATSIVTVNRGHKTFMRKEMFVDKFHLSAEGQEALAEQQASVIESILKSRDKKASYRDVPTTAAEAKIEEFEEGEDDLYGYPKDEFNDDFLDIDW